MAACVGGSARLEDWKSLISRLPGVLGVEFTLTDGVVREVHVLSDQSRGPKQIVRDVQSAMLAKFQVELDHRIISVAQIPGSLRETRRRVVSGALFRKRRIGCGRLSHTGRSLLPRGVQMRPDAGQPSPCYRPGHRDCHQPASLPRLPLLSGGGAAHAHGRASGCAGGAGSEIRRPEREPAGRLLPGGRP